MTAELHFFPDYTAGNPYQTMLHARLGDVGARAVPVTHLVKHLREQASRPDPGVLSLHWTGPILERATGPFRARLLLDRFLVALDDYRAAGGRLVWTVHNVLPHEARHRWAEIELSQALADRADVVHVLSAATLEAIGDLYAVDPAKVVVIEHSSYLGHYPDSIGRDEARARLGVAPDATVLVTLGLIRPYKGLDLLLDTLDDLGSDTPGLRLLVAGRPIADPRTDALRERCDRDPRVTAQFARVPDAELQVWMRAADLAVLPYRAILNSGAFLLAQTFGLPVVGPRDGALTEWDGQPQVHLFEPDDRASLAAAVRHALDALAADPEGQRAAAAAAARTRSPERMATRFAEVVAPLLG